MEDLDGARVLPGCAAQMLRTLESFGFAWDGPVAYQSGRTAHYAQALATLTALGATFECSCPRRARDPESGYPGTCRSGPTRPGPTATRLRVDDVVVAFHDRAQGECRYWLRERGDVIVRRRDGAFAYQLAVVVDDAAQGVTDVVRGADLLDSTPWQLALQRQLALPALRYLHLPLVLEPGGAKLAKSRRAVGLDAARAGEQLFQALELLRQEPPAELKLESAPAILAWACAHWRPERLAGVREAHARR